ncbi:LOW QUALITY PROTEIN: QWRF motif-containing protein 4-like [Amborella trichopoda]|uniref:LOW QUALITY PROTEIN: QWRF motif-containing protein 4-like n=1 Tax=Amborella trichopoda TaxID=13333 RepID=UPI0009BDB87D|nr:LOW QUALITY PROTEIN: QWRF motif-containing protein 4-like [Amborella trichopoda]|eukprot:XP_020519197.1 LOW QUALITY PROTEIN: QWRF motif-containing protein 4-like [Amborella trichopoda]
MSPGRGGHMGLRPPSPPSPVKTKGVTGFLNMGLELLKGRRSSLGNGNGKGGGVMLIMDEAGQDLRVLNNRLLQSRFLNAKAQFLVEKKAIFAQVTFPYFFHFREREREREREKLVLLIHPLEAHLCLPLINDEGRLIFINAWGSVSKLQESVSHKPFQFHKDKLDHKLNYVLGSPAKAFKAWDGIQREHTVAVSKTKDCLNTVVVSRVPLVDGAKSQAVSQALRQAADVANSIKTIIYLLTTMAQRMASLLLELARVVTKEMVLLEETFELLGVVANLELEERSLRCHIIQLRTQQHKDELPSRIVHA